MSRPDDPGFLSRWSRRKLDTPGAEDADAEDGAPAQDEATVEKTDDEILEELGLPDPADLKEGDDFSGFMKGAVPTRLRNRALRKLWLTSPALANLDELLDYGEDFTDSATVVENMQTAYQVGKGWLKDVAEESPDKDATETETTEDALQPDGNHGGDAAGPVPDDGEDSALALDEPLGGMAKDPPQRIPTADPDPIPAPRRMRFRPKPA